MIVRLRSYIQTSAKKIYYNAGVYILPEPAATISQPKVMEACDLNSIKAKDFRIQTYIVQAI